PVHTWTDGAPPPAHDPTHLLVYRRVDDHRVGCIPLRPVDATMVERWQRREESAKASAEMAARDHGVAIDSAFVTALGSLCAQLIERTVILGSARNVSA